jgi:tRNA/rRNA methyltransferase
MHTQPVNLFDHVRFVLVETSRPGNIGAAARAMKTMGFHDLVLVKPRYEQVLMHEEAVAFASGAQDVLQQARVVNSLDEAIADCNVVAGLSARLREFSPPLMQPREFATSISASMAASIAASTAASTTASTADESTLQAALVFGNERFGLSNEQVERCNVLLHVPTNPDYSSLNLAQAVQIMAYECRMATVSSTHMPSGIGFQGELAKAEQIEGMFNHLEQALIDIDFLDPTHPKKLMSRLRRLFSRSALETEEVNILRGIAQHIQQKNHKK